MINEEDMEGNNELVTVESSWTSWWRWSYEGFSRLWEFEAEFEAELEGLHKMEEPGGGGGVGWSAGDAFYDSEGWCCREGDDAVHEIRGLRWGGKLEGWVS